MMSVMWLMEMQRRAHIEVVCVVLWCLMAAGPEDETLPGGSQEAAGGSCIGIGAVRTGYLHMRLW